MNAKLHTDNSASKQIACKLGTSRLRHISGRLLWMQSKVREGVFKIVQVGTAWNPSDIGTKLLSRDRHLMLLFMLGFVCDGERIGEDQFLKQKQVEFSRANCHQPMIEHYLGEKRKRKNFFVGKIFAL